MKLKLFLILFLLPLYGLGQQVKGPNIKQIAKKLSGKWIVEVSEHDSLKRIQRPYGSKILTEIFINGTLVKKELRDGYHIVEMSFNEFGDGEQKVNLNYVPNSKIMEIIEDQPGLQLIIKNDKPTLIMTYLTGSKEVSILELTETHLILLSASEGKKAFRKLNN